MVVDLGRCRWGAARSSIVAIAHSLSEGRAVYDGYMCVEEPCQAAPVVTKSDVCWEEERVCRTYPFPSACWQRHLGIGTCSRDLMTHGKID